MVVAEGDAEGADGIAEALIDGGLAGAGIHEFALVFQLGILRAGPLGAVQEKIRHGGIEDAALVADADDGAFAHVDAGENAAGLDGDDDGAFGQGFGSAEGLGAVQAGLLGGGEDRNRFPLDAAAAKFIEQAQDGSAADQVVAGPAVDAAGADAERRQVPHGEIAAEDGALGAETDMADLICFVETGLLDDGANGAGGGEDADASVVEVFFFDAAVEAGGGAAADGVGLDDEAGVVHVGGEGKGRAGVLFSISDHAISEAVFFDGQAASAAEVVDKAADGVFPVGGGRQGGQAADQVEPGLVHAGLCGFSRSSSSAASWAAMRTYSGHWSKAPGRFRAVSRENPTVANRR